MLDACPDLADDVVLDCESALASVGCSRYQRTCSTCRRSSALYMAGDTDLENNERRSTGTSTTSLTINRLLSLKSRLSARTGAVCDIGHVPRPSRVSIIALASWSLARLTAPTARRLLPGCSLNLSSAHRRASRATAHEVSAQYMTSEPAGISRRHRHHKWHGAWPSVWALFKRRVYTV